MNELLGILSLTAIFTDEKGGSIACEFPPANFDYDEFMKRAK